MLAPSEPSERKASAFFRQEFPLQHLYSGDPTAGENKRKIAQLQKGKNAKKAKGYFERNAAAVPRFCWRERGNTEVEVGRLRARITTRETTGLAFVATT